ncbi:MAG: hypothetical protein WCL02_00070 [bacterium]
MNTLEKKKTKKQLKAEARLANAKIRFIRGQLGNAMFMDTEQHDANNKVHISDWSAEKLRAMADYMEAFPNCTMNPDGSGKPCK